jgi:hypothetical protein
VSAINASIATSAQAARRLRRAECMVGRDMVDPPN